ncbi:hypothetical protein Xcom_02945 [Xanthomonas axonopodis pv. commiphoreae]|nr:hypothetical protein Xcom_02945 [Xanthomonas axonopodis pv. commiphoreae]
MFRSRDPTGGQRRLAVLRAADKTPALTAARAQPRFGIGIRHSYTALVGAPSTPPGERSLPLRQPLRDRSDEYHGAPGGCAFRLARACHRRVHRRRR